jgi:glycopeptide antibiotics resistance protein
MARIDAFSDVIFGFAITLLVVSLEVPHTFAELHNALRGFIPFGICFLMLILLWYSHFKFFGAGFAYMLLIPVGQFHGRWERLRLVRLHNLRSLDMK